ncbi:uncharacterized protein LOC130739420 isoform X2 [Lotus japonicus]|uniref:uncharacterized protein LOC130739420 isoform X2 n=1 Tax=Lotus japonicus TaxID=34305 RepID=UPI002589B42C|nr:uncharacterized protein LOC130739420 isoform X2 [Lotus japonicus]
MRTYVSKKKLKTRKATKQGKRQQPALKRHSRTNFPVATTTINVFFLSFWFSTFFLLQFAVSQHTHTCFSSSFCAIIVGRRRRTREGGGDDDGRCSINSIATKWICLRTLHTTSPFYLLWPSWHCHRKNEQLLWSAKVMMLLGSTALIMLMGQIFSNYLSPVSWWDKDITALIEQKDGKKRILVSFECETLKADKAAEDHIRQFMPKLAGLDAIVNIGRMTISGLDFGAAEAETECKI